MPRFDTDRRPHSLQMASGTSSSSAGTQHEDRSLGSRATYFPRQLSISDDSILNNRVDEAGLLAIAGNKVVLGEPGMGKSELMRELGRWLGVEAITAIR